MNKTPKFTEKDVIDTFFSEQKSTLEYLKKEYEKRFGYPISIINLIKCAISLYNNDYEARTKIESPLREENDTQRQG